MAEVIEMLEGSRSDQDFQSVLGSVGVEELDQLGTKVAAKDTARKLTRQR